MTDHHHALDQGAGGNHIAVSHFEFRHLKVVLNIARQDQLNALKLFWKQIEAVAPVNVACDFLPKIRDIADRVLPIDQTGHRMTMPVCRPDNRGPFVVGEIAKPKRDAVPFKDMSHGDAEWRPRKLDEREHGVYMTEAGRNFNAGENQEINRRPESAITWRAYFI